jgi:type I restriction enzyme M protein
VAVAEYLQQQDGDGNLVLNAQGNREHFNSEMFHGFDFDPTMLRIGSMNMMLHGIENPKIEARDSLSEDHAGVNEEFTLILANPPFKGSVDKEGIASNLTKVIDTAKTELLFRALFLRLLKKGGRHAPLPEGERILVTGSQKSACYFRLTINSRGDLLPSLSPITCQIPSAPRYCLSEI